MLPTGVVSVVTVPGSASGVRAIAIKKGYRYCFSSSGSIRVGVLFEGDTEPRGWYTHDRCGSGCPAPEAYKFALLVKVGDEGWGSVSELSCLSRLGTKHDGLQMMFGINDTKLDDNTGAFTVTVTESGPSYPCKNACPPFIWYPPRFGWYEW